MVGSWAYDNTYNEIWGFEINNHEFAVIGSTAGTHIFDVSNVQNIYETAFISGAYTGGGVIHRDYHDFDGYLYAVCDEGSSSTLQIIDIVICPTHLMLYMMIMLYSTKYIIFLLIQVQPNYMLVPQIMQWMFIHLQIQFYLF